LTEFWPQKTQREAGFGGGSIAPIGARAVWTEGRIFAFFVAKIPMIQVAAMRAAARKARAMIVRAGLNPPLVTWSEPSVIQRLSWP
jgi:hypothetical protein